MIRAMRLAAFVVCVVAVAATFAAQSVLLEPALPAGLAFRHVHSPTARKHLIEPMGGGVALLDYDKDGLLDIFFVNGGQIGESLAAAPAARPFFARAQPRYWNRLYRQNRDGSFTDVTAAAGLSSAGDANYGMGAAAADFDGDGFTDLYVTSFGRNILYRNTGKGAFIDVTARAGVAAGGWSASAGFLDYNNDGRLDLFVTRYMEWSFATSRACGDAIPVYCPPATFPAMTNLLYRNRGDGTFEDVSAASGVAAHPGRALGVAFADYDDDGFTDIAVANDGMEQFLFHNEGNGKFTERAGEAGVALSDDGKPVSGMGIDFRDYDNDNRPDILITTLSRQKYALFHNDGGGLFHYAALESGLGALSAIHSGWGAGLVDFDHDGWKDLFVAQGHVMDNVEKIDPSLRSHEPPLIAMNRAGRFERASAAAELAPAAGRGAAFGDLNNDGAMDVVMGTLGGTPVVFRNRGAAAGRKWLMLALERGTGARVFVNGRQRQEATAAGSYLSSNDPRVHFGLGQTDTAQVEIRWPSGRVQKLDKVAANQILAVREPAAP